MGRSADSKTLTRRNMLKYGGTIIGGTLLAGCAQSSGSEATETTDRADTTSTATATPTATPGVAPYSASIEPVGEVTFESVPETWVANNGSWADMGIALGQDPPEGVWLPSRYHTQLYDEIPGVSVDKSTITELWGENAPGVETLLSLEGDVYVMDPTFLQNRSKNFDADDVDQIEDNAGPFFGNSIFSRGYAWHQDYRYYTLMEAFERLAQVFREQERYAAFEAVHENFQANLAPVVPARSERPEVAVVWGSGDRPEQFYPYIIDDGTSFKHLTDLKVRDALADTDVKNFYESRGAIDFETLLKIDPETLLLRGQEAKSRTEFQDTVVSFLEGHSIASQLTAVENGDVYRAGPLYQGPITNLVVTERLASALYDTDAALFDRQRVGEIVTGEF